MTPAAFLAALQGRLVDALWTVGPWSRGGWCRRQQRQLRGGGRSVLWVRGPAVAWAEWGARRGYFEVQYMDGLPYLRAVRAPVA